jgi:hypothetical protein
MSRRRHDEFARQFVAIGLLALALLHAESSFEIWAAEPAGLASWTITTPSRAALWVVAHERAPTECEIGKGREVRYVTRRPLCDVHLPVPESFRTATKWVWEPGALDYSETRIDNSWDAWIHFDVLQPAEFHVYRLEARS